MRSPCSRRPSTSGRSRSSVRPAPDHEDPLYDQTRRLAHARRGRVDDGDRGRPGIMEAGMEGAGRDKSIGVSIRLPFESGANSVIAGDAKHVQHEVLLHPQADADQGVAGVRLSARAASARSTRCSNCSRSRRPGKGMPVPIVLLDAPGDPYWRSIDTFVRDTLIARGLVGRPRHRSLHDHRLVRRAAAEVIETLLRQLPLDPFRRQHLVMRMRRGPTDEQLADLNERFGHLDRAGGSRWSSRSRRNVATTTTSISTDSRSTFRSAATAS